jgi:copper resistance protein C
MARRGTVLQLLTTALATAVVLVGAGTGTAAAHDVLVGSAPAAAATVDAAPAAVTLEFSQAPQPLGARVVVTGPGGTSAANGAVQVRDRTVVQPLVDRLPAGSYLVDWRITSADGHPLTGTVPFTVAGDPSPAVASTSSSAATPESGSPVLWLAVGAVIAVAGVLVARQVRRPA